MEHKHKFWNGGGGTFPDSVETQVIIQRECDCGLVGVRVECRDKLSGVVRYSLPESWWQRRSREPGDFYELPEFVLEQEKA
jgi:hypothetical protein